MRPSPRLLWWLSLLLAVGSWAAPAGLPPAAAQVRIPQEALLDEGRLRELLGRGEELERQRRWGEALAQYESAQREFPGVADVEQRVSLARARFDVARRYNDASFVTPLPGMTERAAQDLYAELLLKIHTYYVTQPDWQALFQRGALSWETALREPAFATHFLKHVPEERLGDYIVQLRQWSQTRPVRSRYESRDALATLGRYTQEHLGLPAALPIVEFACGALNGLDAYSGFLTGAQLNDTFSQIEGNFVGLGVEIKPQDKHLLILNVIRGGPAHGAGLKAGDRITAVEGRSVEELTAEGAADMLRGEEGSLVTISLATGAAPARVLQVRRAKVEVPSVEQVKIVDPQLGVGYLRLTSFQKTTTQEIDNALWQLHHAGMRSLIIDVRGNPGGLLSASVEVADKFLAEGVIVSTRGRSPQEDFDYKAHAEGTWRVPLYVLIDGDSASASEIFAGAIHDHRRGTLLGQRSYGKGSVQGIFPLSASKAGARLTTAKFYSPSGQPIAHRGVSPDVTVRVAAKPVVGETGEPVLAEEGRGEQAAGDDAVLRAALQLARQQLSQR